MPLSSDQVAWLETYACEVKDTFALEFEAAVDRFKDGRVLLGRFEAAVESVIKNGIAQFRAVDETHNELCVASIILANTKLRFAWLEYEPT